MSLGYNILVRFFYL